MRHGLPALHLPALAPSPAANWQQQTGSTDRLAILATQISAGEIAAAAAAAEAIDEIKRVVGSCTTDEPLWHDEVREHLEALQQLLRAHDGPTDPAIRDDAAQLVGAVAAIGDGLKQKTYGPPGALEEMLHQLTRFVQTGHTRLWAKSQPHLDTIRGLMPLLPDTSPPLAAAANKPGRTKKSRPTQAARSGTGDFATAEERERAWRAENRLSQPGRRPTVSQVALSPATGLLSVAHQLQDGAVALGVAAESAITYMRSLVSDGPPEQARWADEVDRTLAQLSQLLQSDTVWVQQPYVDEACLRLVCRIANVGRQLETGRRERPRVLEEQFIYLDIFFREAIRSPNHWDESRDHFKRLEYLTGLLAGTLTAHGRQLLNGQ